jgi:hypothetical protein
MRGVKEEFQVPSGEPTKVQQSPISIYLVVLMIKQRQASWALMT